MVEQQIIPKIETVGFQKLEKIIQRIALKEDIQKIRRDALAQIWLNPELHGRAFRAAVNRFSGDEKLLLDQFAPGVIGKVQKLLDREFD